MNELFVTNEDFKTDFGKDYGFYCKKHGLVTKDWDLTSALPQPDRSMAISLGPENDHLNGFYCLVCWAESIKKSCCKLEEKELEQA